MVQTKRVDKQFIADLAGKTLFNEELLAKDYYLTRMLCIIKDVKGIYFKGGTALQKIFLNYARLSEDLDFTVTAAVTDTEQRIRELLEPQEFVKKIAHDKSVHKFVRMIIYYDNFSGEEDKIFIDLNERGKLLTEPQTHKITHFYPDIPEFTFQTLSKEEMIAEKVAAAIGRNQPRDHYDIYKIIKAKMPIDMEMIKRKCKDSNIEFSIINIFKNAQKLKNRWDEDLVPLLSEEVGFKEVITTLAKHFKLKEEKKQKKQ